MRRAPIRFLAAIAAMVCLLGAGALALTAHAAPQEPALVVRPPSGTIVAPGELVEFSLEVRDRPGPHRFLLTWLDTGERLGETTTEGAAVFPFQVPAEAAPGSVLRFLAEAEAEGTADPFRAALEVELRVLAPAATPGPDGTRAPRSSPSPSPSALPSTTPAPVAAVEHWEGSFSFQIDAIDGDSGSVSFGSIVAGAFTFTVERPTGADGVPAIIRGQGEATRTSYGGRSGDCAISFSYPPEHVTFDLLGVLLLGKFLIILSEPNPTTTTITTTCPGSAPLSGTVDITPGTALHTFSIELPAEDGARFTVDQRTGSLHERGELTVRRATAPPVR